MPGMNPNPAMTPQAAPAGANPDDQLKDVITRLMGKISAPRTALGAPLQPQVPEKAKMQTGPFPNPSAGREGFLYNLGASVHNAVAQNKEKQVRAAMADWMGLQAAHERMELAGKQLQDDPVAQAILGDPKKMKNMAKAFSMDWLNPEKQTVYGEALKRTMQADKAGKMVKLMRALHLKAQQQPQFTPQEQQQFTSNMAQRVETMTRPVAGAGQIKPQDLVTDLIRMQHESGLEERFQKSQTAAAEREAAREKEHQATEERHRQEDITRSEQFERRMSAQEARMERMGEKKGYIIGDKKIKAHNVGQDQDIPEHWISEEAAKKFEIPGGRAGDAAHLIHVVQGLIPPLQRLVDANAKDLGAFAGRWNKFKLSNLGAKDPNYAELRTMDEFVKSATALMHFGQRGASQTIQEKNAKQFVEALDSGKMAPENIKAGLKAVQFLTQQYINEGEPTTVGSPLWMKRYKEANKAQDLWTPVE